MEFLADGIGVAALVDQVVQPHELVASAPPQAVAAESLVDGIEVMCGGAQQVDVVVADAQFAFARLGCGGGRKPGQSGACGGHPERGGAGGEGFTAVHWIVDLDFRGGGRRGRSGLDDGNGARRVDSGWGEAQLVDRSAVEAF
ncbi:hypothetical protein [Streptomyces sp. NPDC048155]|uniref:hypothetical protein n=1 Tax=Streptomyces sp. NPDC048155 TaxID=3154818 RepID=UPI0033EBF372